MATIGSSLDYVKITKNGSVITISETFAIQNFTGQGYANQTPSLETSTNTTVHRKENLQVSVQGTKVILRSLIGATHTFDFNIIDTNIEHKSVLEFAENLLN